MSLDALSLSLDAQIFLRLMIAVALGSLIGYERARKGKPAGVRTHGMVCLGAALFTVVGLYGWLYGFGGVGDAARVAAQIVTGIGFLGAGAILREHGSGSGLDDRGQPVGGGGDWPGRRRGDGARGGGDDDLVFLLLRFGPKIGPDTPHKESD